MFLMQVCRLGCAHIGLILIQVRSLATREWRSIVLRHVCIHTRSVSIKLYYNFRFQASRSSRTLRSVKIIHDIAAICSLLTWTSQRGPWAPPSQSCPLLCILTIYLNLAHGSLTAPRRRHSQQSVTWMLSITYHQVVHVHVIRKATLCMRLAASNINIFRQTGTEVVPTRRRKLI